MTRAMEPSRSGHLPINGLQLYYEMHGELGGSESTPLLLIPGIVLGGGALAWGLLFAPAEGLQGETVRIMYIHVPAAWLGMGGWTAVAVARSSTRKPYAPVLSVAPSTVSV